MRPHGREQSLTEAINGCDDRGHALGLLSEALSQRLGESEHIPLVRRINETECQIK